MDQWIWLIPSVNPVTQELLWIYWGRVLWHNRKCFVLLGFRPLDNNRITQLVILVPRSLHYLSFNCLLFVLNCPWGVLTPSVQLCKKPLVTEGMILLLNYPHCLPLVLVQLLRGWNENIHMNTWNIVRLLKLQFPFCFQSLFCVFCGFDPCWAVTRLFS